MGNFSGTILTNRGRNLLAKALTGVCLNFTRIGIGDGLWQEGDDPSNMIALVREKKSLPIQEMKNVGDGTSKLRFVLTNSGLAEGFFIREIGIFANDPDLGEILYAVTSAGDKADYIPAAGAVVIESVTDIFTVVSNAPNVTAQISDTVVIATKKDIANHNESLSSHQDIRTSVYAHIQSTTVHNIYGQINAAISAHKADAGAHAAYGKYYVHSQDTPANIWKVNHNFNTPNIPVIRAYNETTEEVYFSGYCGSGIYCGDGSVCGAGGAVNAKVVTEIQISNICLVSQNMLDIRFAVPQSGKAVILI